MSLGSVNVTASLPEATSGGAFFSGTNSWAGSKFPLTWMS